MFKLALSLNIFLLKLGYNIIIELYLLKALIIFSIGLRCFKSILLLVRLEGLNGLLQLLSLVLVSLNLVYKLLELILLSLNGRELVSLLLLSSCHILVEKVTLPCLLFNVFSVLVDLLLFLIKSLGDSLEGGLDVGPVLNSVIENDPDLGCLLAACFVDLLFFMVSFFKLLDVIF